MNKLFAFLCLNAIIPTLQSENSQENSTRNLNFESWSNIAQPSEDAQRSSLNEEEEEENETKDSNE